MNKLLLTTFLLVISTGVPALAVDYVACREMQRTKNEFIMLVNKEDKELDELICYTDDPFCKELQSFIEPITEKRKRREKYYKKALKVKADMKKANCPY